MRPLVHRGTVALVDAPSDSNAKRLRVLERAIAKHELLLELARTVEGGHYRRSNRGWMVSMFTLEAGTLLAVLSGHKARRWSALIQSLELDLALLKMERRLCQRALGATASST